MFIYSVRAGTLKFVGAVCVALVCLITLVTFIPNSDRSVTDTSAGMSESTQTVKYDKIKSEGDVADFIGQFGWSVSEKPIEVKEVTIPAEFDRIFTSYNEIQKQQGLDLSKYKRKNVMRYTFELTNYKDYEGKVYVNILVYRNRVIGGDVCSADMTGFMHGFDVK